MRVLVVGDLMEDVIVLPQGPIRKDTDTVSKISKSLGGAAANVAAWLAFAECDVTFVGCVDQFDVEQFSRVFLQNNVKPILQSSLKSTGALIAIVEGESRTMLTDRGANNDLQLPDISVTAFDLVYISGYALLGKAVEEVKEFILSARNLGALVAIDPGSTGFIRDFGVERFRELLLLADISFPNQEEEQLLQLAGNMPLTVITQGSVGAEAIESSGQRFSVAAQSVSLLDPTGAGDAFCAGFLSQLKTPKLQNSDIAAGLTKGIELGALAVSKIGAKPSSWRD